MMRDRVRDVLKQVGEGGLEPEGALDELWFQPVETLPFASIDHHRDLRQGFPEVIYGEGKTDDQIVAIAERVVEHSGSVLVTRAPPSAATALPRSIAGAVRNQLGRTALVRGETY